MYRTLPPSEPAPTRQQLEQCDKPHHPVSCFDNFLAFFDAVCRNMASRNGQPFEVLDVHSDPSCSFRVYRIRFQDNVEIDAYPGEVCMPCVSSQCRCAREPQPDLVLGG
jgi:hypothetical protein